MIHSSHRPARRRTRPIVWVGLLISVCLVAALPGAASAVEADAGWGPTQEAPPNDGRPHVVSLPDGTLVAVWSTFTSDGHAGLLRSTRPPAGSWTSAEVFPVTDGVRLIDVAGGSDGVVHVSYARETDAGPAYEVRAWNPDGTVGAVTLSDTGGAYDLHSDGGGDLVAQRAVRREGSAGFEHRLHYFDGSAWQAMPTIGAELRDIFVPGVGDRVWAVSYDRPDNTLRVRRWQPGMATWAVAWARDYPPRHPNDPFVAGMDFAVGRAGHAVLAFYERPTGRSPATVRVVRRAGRSGWTRAAVLQRVPLGQDQVVTAPVVAAVGRRAEVAWTVPAQWGTRRRVVRIAALGDDQPLMGRLAVVRAFRGFWDLSLDVDAREGGDVLVTYVERQTDRRDLVGWLGPHDDLGRATLIEDLWSAYDPVTSVLVPGLAVVTASSAHGRLVSRGWQS